MRRRFFFITESLIRIGSRKSFIKQAYGAPCLLSQPTSELATFAALLAFITIAMNRQPYHEAADILLTDKLLEIGGLLLWILPYNYFPGACENSSWITNRNAHTNGTVVNRRQSPRLGKRDFICLRTVQRVITLIAAVGRTLAYEPGGMGMRYRTADNR